MHISNKTSTNKKQIFCNHCKKSDYTKAQCYRLVGFPANFKFTKSKREDPKATVQNVTTMSAPSISPEQYEHLLQLLSTNTINQLSSVNQIHSSIIEGSLNNGGKKFPSVHLLQILTNLLLY